MRNVSKIIFIIYFLHFLQRRFDKIKHQFGFKHNDIKIHKRRNDHDSKKHDEKQFNRFTNRSRTMCQMIQNSRFFFHFDKIQIDSFSSFVFFVKFRNNAEIFKT